MVREQREGSSAPAEHNLRTAEAFARGTRKQQEGFRVLVQGWTDAYEGFIFYPFDYAREGMKTAQEATEQGLQATQQITQQGLHLAEEATEQTEEVLRQTEEATREVELRTSVLAALETDNYDAFTVTEITEKLDDLSADELKKLRELEKRNKDRESLVERIDSKIRANS